MPKGGNILIGALHISYKERSRTCERSPTQLHEMRGVPGADQGRRTLCHVIDAYWEFPVMKRYYKLPPPTPVGLLHTDSHNIDHD